MALPTGPIPRVAFDEIIEEPWGDSVAQSINNMSQMFEQLIGAPDAETDATESTTTFTNWFRFGGASGEILVPDWAHHLLAKVEIHGVRDEGGGTPTTYDMRVVVGTVEGRVIRQCASAPAGHFSAQWTDWLALDAGDEGTQGVWVQVKRVSGTSHWTIDTDSDVGLFVTFLGAPGWYPAL